MSEPRPAGADREPEGAGKTSRAVHGQHKKKERLAWAASQESRRETCHGMQERWEGQLQQFLKSLQPILTGRGSPGMSEASPWEEDTKEFLASFEQVAKACRWPRDQWAAHLLPALSGEAEEAFRGLEARDQENYEKVKAAILRGEALRTERQRQHFRQFCCQEVEDPRRIHSQLQELCRQWLRPERRSKEQILELLILEQFLASLPPELRSWIQARRPESCPQAVALVEDFLMSQQEAKSRTPQESVDFDLAVHFTEEESSSLGPAPKAFYKEILQDGREKGRFWDHVKEETLQPGSPELEAAHETQRPCGEGLVKPLSQKGNADLENPEGRTLPRRWLWKEGQTLNQHLTHISEQKHSRPECGEQFHYQLPAVQHQMIHTDIKPKAHQNVCPKEITPLGYPGCEKSFTHQAMDTGEGSGARSACGRRFREWIQPSRHRVMQGGEAAYECRLCRKKFRRKRNLVAHQKTHTGERPHSCSQCGRSFSEKAKLIRHERVHTGEKPYACPTCPKSFSQRETLLRHRRIHTAREKPYQGFVGGEDFGQRETPLLRHHRKKLQPRSVKLEANAAGPSACDRNGASRFLSLNKTVVQ